MVERIAQFRDGGDEFAAICGERELVAAHGADAAVWEAGDFREHGVHIFGRYRDEDARLALSKQQPGAGGVVGVIC